MYPWVTFSPPAWGWSALVDLSPVADAVLPTRVGMVRSNPPPSRPRNRSPHPRGDGPAGNVRELYPYLFSPPAWGWSGCGRRVSGRERVLPTRVGMVGPTRPRCRPRPGSPHPRGDGPCPPRPPQCLPAFSPPAWGWSARRSRPDQPRPVLPTRVGMVRTYAPCPRSSPSSPHPRGDGPAARAEIVAA